MKIKSILLTVILIIASLNVSNAASSISRDSCMSIASTFCYATWTAKTGNCNSTYNNYTVGQITVGIDYQWGGYDSLSTALARLFSGATAGDSYPTVTYPSAYWAGDDCSGYASRCWVSGHYVTSSFPSICSTISYADLYKGDLTDYSGSHCRLFDYFNPGNHYLMNYECTAGVSPKRVTHRALAQDNNYVPMRYLLITPFLAPAPVNDWALYSN